jgi:hypothetical protein
LISFSEDLSATWTINGSTDAIGAFSVNKPLGEKYTSDLDQTLDVPVFFISKRTNFAKQNFDLAYFGASIDLFSVGLRFPWSFVPWYLNLYSNEPYQRQLHVAMAVSPDNSRTLVSVRLVGGRTHLILSTGNNSYDYHVSFSETRIFSQQNQRVSLPFPGELSGLNSPIWYKR